MVPPDAALMENATETDAATPEQKTSSQSCPAGWVEVIDEASGQP